LLDIVLVIFFLSCSGKVEASHSLLLDHHIQLLRDLVDVVEAVDPPLALVLVAVGIVGTVMLSRPSVGWHCEPCEYIG
jgi:hypothetical protein